MKFSVHTGGRNAVQNAPTFNTTSAKINPAFTKEKSGDLCPPLLHLSKFAPIEHDPLLALGQRHSRLIGRFQSSGE
jgi:hypothetical protein